MKNKSYVGAAAVILLWIFLTVAAWLHQPETISESERRKLAQFPDVSVSTVLSGEFASDFEAFATDQFPLRDLFRQGKALFHYYVLGQKDNNGIYLTDGYAAKLEYPMNEQSVRSAVDHFNRLYEMYLQDTAGNIYMSVVPDKGYYLAEQNGYPAMDYEALFAAVREGVPWAEYIDLTGALEAGDYYRTDTHWRQERIGNAAQRLAEAMGVSVGEFVPTALEKPFYGVYYGQAALPMRPETMYLMESELLSQCTVYNHETGKTAAVYDLEKLTSRDLYDVFLSGSAALLTIENPSGQPGKELVVFRDSFGSAMIPLLVQDYSTMTVIDTRYIAADLVGNYVNFQGKDVLFLYSTLILNNSSSLK